MQWPALSAFCGLKPWDADPENPGCLTWGEAHVYLSALRERAEEMARQEAAMNERR